MTNIQMHDYLEAAKADKHARIDRDGCCGNPGEPFSDGICFGVGMCPRIVQANNAAAFCQSYLAWLQGAVDESALAAVAARLSDGSVYEGIAE